MLRTHTSAHEVETFAKGVRQWLLTADVYRRDEIDASHYPVFHQVEGARVFDTSAASIQNIREENERLSHRLAKSNIVIEDIPHVTDANPVQHCHKTEHAEVVAVNLKLSLNSLILDLFGRAGATDGKPLRVRWIEAYFPFTTPSYEVEVFFNGKWLEILGCGVVLQRTLDRAGVRDSISWAFGLGLERIAMILFSIPDIRLFWSKDPRFSEQFTPGVTNTFKPYSRHPSCYKDVSFWLSDVRMHENDFCDLVRDAAGDTVESVMLIDAFTNRKTQRSSACYRINYRSMDRLVCISSQCLIISSGDYYRSLTNDEANTVHEQVKARLKDKFGVEIR